MAASAGSKSDPATRLRKAMTLEKLSFYCNVGGADFFGGDSAWWGARTMDEWDGKFLPGKIICVRRSLRKILIMLRQDKILVKLTTLTHLPLSLSPQESRQEPYYGLDCFLSTSHRRSSLLNSNLLSKLIKASSRPLPPSPTPSPPAPSTMS